MGADLGDVFPEAKPIGGMCPLHDSACIYDQGTGDECPQVESVQSGKGNISRPDSEGDDIVKESGAHRHDGENHHIIVVSCIVNI